MELAGHKRVGFCEFDKFAVASYTSMHLITDEQREYLKTLPLKKRQKEILKEEYKNGEWYASDIMGVDAAGLPTADCWCFGAPCQDFSVAGKRAGLRGDRSSLVSEIFRLLEELKEENRPEWLIYENVKGMLSSNRGLDFLTILAEMDRLGYDIEWQNLHSEWYVPQHRERIYTVGHLRRRGRRKIFPIEGADGENSVCQTGNYLPTKTKQNPNQGRVYDPNGIAPCLTTMEGGGRAPSVWIKVIGTVNPQIHSAEDIHAEDGIMSCLTSRDYKSPKKVAVPVSTQVREVTPKEFAAPVIWCEKYQCYIAIRRLTPKECFRLQGWTDIYYERAAFVNSESQLYKQAGNGVTVPVVQVVAERMEEMKVEEGTVQRNDG